MERTECAQLQRLSGAPVHMIARTLMTTRGNPDRGTPVPTTKPFGLPHEAARRLHPAARDCSLPRSSCPRQMCARSCRVHAKQLHRCPPGLLHPRRTPRSPAKMPNMCSDDGAALPPTPKSRIRIPNVESWSGRRSLSGPEREKKPTPTPESGFGKFDPGFRRGHVCGNRL